MKTWKPQLLTLLGVTLAGAALAEPVTVPVTLKNGNAWPLGTGYDSLDQKIKGFCVTNGLGADGKPIDPTRDVIEGSNKLDFERDENAVKSKLSLSGSGRYQTGATTMSLAADFYKASKSNEYRSTFTLVRENFIREAMNQDLRGLIKPYPDAVKYTKTKMDWYNNCGDMFVRARLLSAKLFVNISFSFVSKEEKESFKTKFDLTSAMAEGHLKFDQGAESLSAGNRITVQAYQIGGDTSNLGRTLCAATVVADSKNPDDLKPDPNCDQSSRAIVSCGFGDMTKCSQMFASAVAYGNGNGVGQFGSQIADGKNFSLTELEMAPYDAVKGTFPATPKLPEIKNQRQARVDAEALYNKQWELFTRAEALWLGRAPRLSSEQRDDMETFKAELFENAKKLADAVDVCYDKGVDECVAKTKAATPKAKRAGADWETEQNQFIQDHSVAVSYVQFCDIADDSHRSTKRTVETLREYIRLHTRKEKYESIEKGDRCLNEAGFLEALTELTLPAAKDSLHPDVADLGPIGALKRLTKLALPGQGILDVKPLAGLANLEELTLGDNQIADASPLAKLGNLRKLDLQNNELTTIAPLADLRASLRILDASGNSLRDASCPIEGVGHCQFVSFRHYADMSSAYTKCDDTVHAAAVAVDDDHLIATGGRSNTERSTHIQLVSNQGCRVLPKGLSVPRIGHTMTMTSKGILVIGGGTNQIEVIDPKTGEPHPFPVALPEAVTNHTATKVTDQGGAEAVLVVGGETDSDAYSAMNHPQAITNGVQLVYPDGRVKNLGRLEVPRAEHTATLLDDGTVLIVGGYSLNQMIESVERIDPRSGRIWRVKDALPYGRTSHTAMKLANGQVLIAGGNHWVKGPRTDATDDPNQVVAIQPIDQVLLFNPESESFREGMEKLKEPVYSMQAVATNDNRVLLFGGMTKPVVMKDGVHVVRSASTLIQVYDPQSEAFYKVNDLLNNRMGFTATALGKNQVLVFGGTPASTYAAERNDAGEVTKESVTQMPLTTATELLVYYPRQ